MVCARRTIGSVITLDARMVLSGDEAQVEAHFGCFGDKANFDARFVHGLQRFVPLDRKSFLDGTAR